MWRERKRALIALAVALLAGVGLLALAARVSSRTTHEQQVERLSIIDARALADLAAAVPVERAAALQQTIRNWMKRDTAIRSVRVVDIYERSLVASSIAADASEGELPRRLVRAEKSLYDTGQRLRTAVETNREENVSRKEVTEISTGESGALTVAAPYERDGEVVGYVDVAIQPPLKAQKPSLLLPLVISISALVVLALAGILIGERRRVLATVALLILTASLFSYAVFLQSSLRGAEARFAKELTRVDAANAADILNAARTAGVPAQPDPKKWDADRFGRPYGAEALQKEVTAMRRTTALVWAIAAVVLLFFGLGGAEATRKALVRNRVAYAYILPSIFGMLLLVFFPFIYGIALSFTDQNIYNTNKPLTEIWTGIHNYTEILGDTAVTRHTAQGLAFNYTNFYWTLGFTIIWTISNVTVGVTIGLLLALALNTKGLRFKPIYRVLLILPWAVPNYITALIWRGMFHQQFGVVNQVMRIFGGEGFAWFDKPLTSFIAVLTTNGWLSFPFMMVVSLGALQSISADLYEAARVDGASRWQQFRLITIPSLKPALIPAIILSVVWTFNMFNIIYLVSAGQPAGATEILITQSYKIAFEQYRYGYAAAYSTIIFGILLIYGTWQNRVTRATEGI